MNTHVLPLLAVLLAAPTFAQDECTSATPVNPGIFGFDTNTFTQSPEPWSCAGGGAADAWFSITVGTNEVITLSLCGSTYDTAIEVFDGDDCNNLTLLACNDDACGLQSSTTFVGTMGQTYLFRVGGFQGETGVAALMVAAQSGGLSNDVCAGAIPLTDGTIPYSTVGATDGGPGWPCAGGGGADIWYSFSAAGTSVNVSTCGSSYDTALEVFSGACGNLTSLACLDDSCGLQSDITVTTVPGIPYLVRVGGFDGSSGNGMLSITGTGDGMPGTNYCMANPNSTGSAASMSASGTPLVADNDLTLMTSGLPGGTFCVYLTSQNSGFVPNFAGSSGNLCVTGALAAFTGPGEIQRANLAGEVSLAVDLTMVPTPAGRVPAMAGETWSFQAWFRDRSMAGPTSNFSDGLEVLLF